VKIANLLVWAGVWLTTFLLELALIVAIVVGPF
jgi:hypothetical protein